MTLEQYKEKIRTYRGHLKSCDAELEAIYEYGTPSFIEFTLKSKAIGVSKMAHITDCLSDEQQEEFVSWMSEKVRKKVEIDTYLLDKI